MIKKGFFLVVIMSVLTACGGADSSAGSDSVEAPLAGVWVYCESFTRTSTQLVHEYSGTGFVHTREDFLNDDCSGVPLISEEVLEGTYTVGRRIESPGGPLAYELNLYVESVFGGNLSYDASNVDSIGKTVFASYSSFTISENTLHYADLTKTNNKSARSTGINLNQRFSQN